MRSGPPFCDESLWRPGPVFVLPTQPEVWSRCVDFPIVEALPHVFDLFPDLGGIAGEDRVAYGVTHLRELWPVGPASFEALAGKRRSLFVGPLGTKSTNCSRAATCTATSRAHCRQLEPRMMAASCG